MFWELSELVSSAGGTDQMWEMQIAAKLQNFSCPEHKMQPIAGSILSAGKTKQVVGFPYQK